MSIDNGKHQGAIMRFEVNNNKTDTTTYFFTSIVSFSFAFGWSNNN